LFNKNFYFILGVIVIGFFLVSCNNQKLTILQKNKTIAATLVHDALEKGIFDPTYLDPEIVLECPPAFKFPPLGVHTFKGIDQAEQVVKAWKLNTIHDIDVIDTIAEGDKVVVIINAPTRVFKTPSGNQTFYDHSSAHVFQFKNGKVIKVNSFFDVIDAIEKIKVEKYKFKSKK